MGTSQKLIFVYNAKGGFMHSTSGLFQKTATPGTYPCKLCSLTYSGAFMKKVWKEYVTSLGMDTVFLHKDEFVETYPRNAMSFPVVLLARGNDLKTLISSNDFKELDDLTDLIKLMSERLNGAKRQG